MATEEQLVIVRDHDSCQMLHCESDWDPLTLLACVSSDPRSFRELSAAWLRYRAETPLDELPWQLYSAADGHRSIATWLVIDLANQVLQSNCDDAIPARRSSYQRDDSKWTSQDQVVWINFPPGWERAISTAAVPQFAAPKPYQEPTDFRGVLFGRAMAADFAVRMQQIAATETLPADHLTWDEVRRGDPDDGPAKTAKRWHELTIAVHADWLNTPRSDLDGGSPRPFLHRGREWVEWEVENRCRQWSQLRQAPRGLDKDSFAWMHGPMGRDEVVIYFMLCREVIHAGWKALCESPQLQHQVEQWATLMHNHGQQWLENGRIDGDSKSPAELIDNSRRHMPAVADHSSLDCECPICRMMADEQEQFAPMFSGFDGHQLDLDGDFTFSLCTSRDEWQEMQASYEFYSESADKNAIIESANGAATASAIRIPTSADDATPPGMVAIGMAFRMAEFIGELQRRDETHGHITTLNAAFDAARHARVDATDLRIAVESLKHELQVVTDAFPDLVSRSSELQTELDEWASSSPAV